MAGLAWILVANIKDRVRSTIFWISLFPAIACPLLYYVKYQSLTAEYGDSRVICGTVYTTKGADYASNNPEKTKEELIEDFAGQTAAIWTEDSINKARVVLGLFYSVAVAFLAFAALIKLQNAKPPKGT